MIVYHKLPVPYSTDQGQARGYGRITHKRGRTSFLFNYIQTVGHTSLPWVPNERSGYCLSKDTSQYVVGPMAW